MPAVQTVNFLSPVDQVQAQIQQQQAARQQALADALRQSSLQGIPVNQGPISWTQGLAKLAEAIAANHVNRNAMASQYSGAANAYNAQARMMGAPGNVVDASQNPYASNESGRNLGQRLGDFIRGGAPIGVPQAPAGQPPAGPGTTPSMAGANAQSASIVPQQIGPAPTIPAGGITPPQNGPVPQLPAPSQGAMAAPPTVDPAVGGQPPMPSAAPPAAAPVPNGAPPPMRSPLALTPNWQANMLLSQSNPEEYSKAVIGQNTPTDLGKMMAQAGIDSSSALGHQILQANIAKQNYIAPVNARGGSWTINPDGSKDYNPNLPEGSEPMYDRKGNVVGIRTMDGVVQSIGDLAAAKAGGAAKYNLTQVMGPDGDMHSVPVANVAGGAPGGGGTPGAPASGGLNGFYGRGPTGAPAAPGGNVSGLGPGNQSAATTAGGNSANGFNQAIQGGVDAKNAIRTLTNITTAAQGLQTGEGAGALNELKSGVNVLAGQVGLHPFDTRNIAAFDEIKKNAATLGNQLSSGATGGGGTDARLSNALSALPNTNYSPAAIQEVGTNLKSLQQAAIGRSQAATQWQGQNGANSFPQFQQAWQKAYNPDLYYHIQKGDVSQWVGGMGKSAAAQVLGQYRQLKALGGL